MYEFRDDYNIAHIPDRTIGRNYARIHGITGFIINHNYQPLSLVTTWTGNKFIFDLEVSQQITQYFSFAYAFLIGSQCSSCNGYPFSYQGICVKSCPKGSYPKIDKNCI